MTRPVPTNSPDFHPGTSGVETAIPPGPEDVSLTGDYDEAVVPLSRRRSKTVMFLIWVTLQIAMSVIYTGFLARSEGLDLGQLLIACVVGLVAMLLYGFGAANVGAATGQALALLARTVFGRVGTSVVSILLIIMGIGWYAFQARFLAQLLGGLFTGLSVTLFGAVFALFMMANNLFGFRGIATFARFVAAPILLIWGAYALIKAIATVPSSSAFAAAPHVAAPTTIMVIAGLLVGGAVWGNEPDVFRYSRGRPWWNTPALVGGYTIGIFFFPILGYLLAELAAASTLNPFIKHLVPFSLFGVTALAVILFAINQFALNDGNLYEAVNAMQNLIDRVRSWRRLYSVLVLGAIGAVVAASMSSLQKDFFIVAGISAVFVPCATTIIAVDVFVLPRLIKGRRRPVHRITSWPKVAVCNWLGLTALVAGLAVGSYTGGLIPGLSGFGTANIGYPALQAWAVAAGLYVLLAVAVPAKHREVLLGYPHTMDEPERDPRQQDETSGAVPS
jgi:purine-cytosine permease-like protein